MSQHSSMKCGEKLAPSNPMEVMSLVLRLLAAMCTLRLLRELENEDHVLIVCADMQ